MTGIPHLFFTICLLFSLSLSFLLFRKLAGWPRNDRFITALIPPMTVCLAALFLLKIQWSLYDDRNWERLFNAFALARGFPIYQEMNSGPVLITLCGPVSAIAFMPAAFAPSPTAAMFVASFILMAFYFLPAAWLHFAPALDQAKPDAKNLVYRTFLFLIFCFFPFICKPLRDAAFSIHVDGPTLGLAAIACGFLYFRGGKNKEGALFFSALFAVLSIWSKQVAVPLLAALPFYLAITDGWKTAFRYVLYLAVCGMAISAIFLFVFGPERVFFNLLTIPSRHGFRNGSSWSVAESSYRLLGETAAVLILAAISRPWRSLFFIVAIAMVPVSILGNAKIGGSTNTFSYAAYFLLLAAALGFLNHASSTILRRFLVLLSVFFLCLEIPAVYYRIDRSRHQFNYAEAAFAYIKRHPGETYFPRLTLLHLMAENKIYHGSTGLLDRAWAGMPVRGEHLRAHLPERMNMAAFRRGTQGDWAQIGLPEYQSATSDPELPGFIVYKKRDVVRGR